MLGRSQEGGAARRGIRSLGALLAVGPFDMHRSLACIEACCRQSTSMATMKGNSVAVLFPLLSIVSIVWTYYLLILAQNIHEFVPKVPVRPREYSQYHCLRPSISIFCSTETNIQPMHTKTSPKASPLNSHNPSNSSPPKHATIP